MTYHRPRIHRLGAPVGRPKRRQAQQAGAAVAQQATWRTSKLLLKSMGKPWENGGLMGFNGI